MTAVETVEVDGRLGVVVAELSGDVLRLTRELRAVRDDLEAMRSGFAREARSPWPHITVIGSSGGVASPSAPSSTWITCGR